ncbi:MAG: PilZ domain-containing protein [Pseudobdellovibrio sp.]
MSTNLDFYNVVDQEKYSETLNLLIHDSTEIVIKINNQHCRTKIISKKSDTEFTIARISSDSFSANALKNERVTASFESNKSKFFFKTSLNSDKNEMRISVPTEIFQLQRRNDFRVTIPMTVKVAAEIQTLNGKRIKEKIEIRDISLGGCQLVLKKSNFNIKKNDEIQIKIKMLDLEVDLLPCKIKHVLELPDNLKNQLGISFSEPNVDFLTDLQSLLIHLDRILRGKGYD